MKWIGSHPGGAPGLQNRRGALDVPGGFDSHPFPTTMKPPFFRVRPLSYGPWDSGNHKSKDLTPSPPCNKYKAMTPQQLFGNSLGISAGANDGFFYYLQNIRHIDRFCYIFSETGPPPLFDVFGHCSSGNGNNWNIFSLGCFL
jgi:hypothetical protein